MFVMSEHFYDVLGVDFLEHIELDRFRELTNVAFERADLLTYRGKPRDFLFCASVVEHIPKARQNDFIANIRNNLKDGGHLYLSFPPFNSINGGHFATPFHFLPDKLALWCTRKIKKYDVYSYEAMFGEWGLYKTSIKEVENMLKDNGFEILKLGSRHMPPWFERMFARSNILNWHAEFFCRKI